MGSGSWVPNEAHSAEEFEAIYGFPSRVSMYPDVFDSMGLNDGDNDWLAIAHTEGFGGGKLIQLRLWRLAEMTRLARMVDISYIGLVWRPGERPVNGKCIACGGEAFVLFNTVECGTWECRNYKA